MTYPLVIIQLVRLGDVVSLLPMLKAYADDGTRCALMVHKDFASVLDGVSYADCIPFEGEYYNLDQARSEAAKVADKIICCQVLGATDVVKRCTYQPAGQEHAETDSFVKEPWQLARRMADYRKHPPIVFDRRDAAREAKLVKEHIAPKKKNILVALGGSTNPFPYSEMLLELLKLRFKTGYSIVDISEVRAERFYDFVGLYEKAHCLIASDSAPLHLARAVPQLPTVALANDKPLLWYGAPYSPNHIEHIRYGDFALRGCSVLRAIERIGKPGFTFDSTAEPKIIHAWHGYEVADRPQAHRNALATWEAAYANGNHWVSAPLALGVAGRDSKSSAIKDSERWPFLKDVIRQATMKANDHDVICLTRCDTAFNPSLGEKVLDNAPCYAHRTLDNTFHPMVDMFAFTKAWWRERVKECPDLIMGNDWNWNLTLLDLMRRSGGKELPFAVYREGAASPKRKTKPPPRDTYNFSLYRDWCSKRGDFVLYPAVSKQVPTITINRHALPPYSYNPSLVRFNNRWLMSFRHHDQHNHSTSLMMAELDATLNVKSLKPIAVPHQGGSEEDARLWVQGNELWASYVDTTWPAMPPRCVVKYGRLHEGVSWAMTQPITPPYGKNDYTGTEKNFLFFVQEGRVFCIYASSPKQIVYDCATNKPTECAGLRWPWGEPRGGTGPIPFGDKLLRFFHSSLDNEWPIHRRRYYIGAMLMEPTFPFKPITISKKPIIYGSEEDDLSAMEKSGCIHHKPKVAIPYAAAGTDGGWLLSIGINDSTCAICTLTEKDLNL